MVAILKSASPDFYEDNGLDRSWAGTIEVAGSNLLTHSDFGDAKHHHWFAGCTIFKLTFPHVTMDLDTPVIGYWKSGDAIRAKDIRRHKLDPSKFDRLTRAGYNGVQLIVRPSHPLKQRIWQ